MNSSEVNTTLALIRENNTLREVLQLLHLAMANDENPKNAMTGLALDRAYNTLRDCKVVMGILTADPSAVELPPEQPDFFVILEECPEGERKDWPTGWWPVPEHPFGNRKNAEARAREGQVVRGVYLETPDEPPTTPKVVT